jgi:hypothetical protein
MNGLSAASFCVIVVFGSLLSGFVLAIAMVSYFGYRNETGLLGMLSAASLFGLILIYCYNWLNQLATRQSEKPQ